MDDDKKLGAPLWVRGPPPRPELEGERLFVFPSVVKVCKECARAQLEWNYLNFNWSSRNGEVLSASRSPN